MTIDNNRNEARCAVEAAIALLDLMDREIEVSGTAVYGIEIILHEAKRLLDKCEEIELRQADQPPGWTGVIGGKQ